MDIFDVITIISSFILITGIIFITMGIRELFRLSRRNKDDFLNLGPNADNVISMEYKLKKGGE